MSKITNRSVAIQLMIYLVLSIFGYLSTLDNTPKVFTSRPTPDQMSSGWPMVIGRMLMLFTLVCCIPLNLHPCRQGMFTLIGRPDPPLWMHLGVTFFLLEFTLILAILTPNVIIVFNFLGAIGSITLLVIFPGLMDIQMMNGGVLRKTAVILLMIVLALVGIATFIVTIMQIT